MLARHRVECVVIGGYAAVLAGVDVVTRDIDITPATDQPNLERLAPRSASCTPRSACRTNPRPAARRPAASGPY